LQSYRDASDRLSDWAAITLTRSAHDLKFVRLLFYEQY
jgi:hypothetical protein